MTVTSTRSTSGKPEIVARHLIEYGHISEGTALIEYGSLSVAHAVWRLRRDKKHLLPAGKKIITRLRKDANGQRYGVYHLVSE